METTDTDSTQKHSQLPCARNSTGSNNKKKVNAQLKKDIENSLEPDAKDAIINGYLSLLNKEYILKDELDIDLVSIGNGHQLERRAAKEITQMVKDAKKDGMQMTSLLLPTVLYAKQVYLFKNKIERLERAAVTAMKRLSKEAGTVVAVPGTSEHQLGLTRGLCDRQLQKSG